MIDDDVITRLMEFHDHIQVPVTAPGADAWRGQRLLRRRRAVALGAAAAVIVSVVGVVAAATGDPRSGGDIEPVLPGPSQTPLPSTAEPSPTAEPPSSDSEWPPERIRAKGQLEDEVVTDSGVVARTYVVCDGPRKECSPHTDGPIRRSHEHAAIEVSQGGQSALFGMYRGNSGASIIGVGEDAVLVMDVPPEALGNIEDVRHRVLRPDGTEVLLHIADGTVPPEPGPDVVVLDYNWLMGERVGMQHAFRLDERAGTLQLLDVPRNTELGFGGIDWGPNTGEALWFVTSIDCRVYSVVDGTVEQDEPCGTDFRGHWYDSLVKVDARWFPDGWLAPGRMALLEQQDHELLLFVTLDQGAHWQSIPVDGEDAIPQVLQQLG